MLGRLRNSFVEVDLTALEQNYLSLQSALKNCAMAPMVKADGYGHGDVQVARVCERLGARYLGVALIEEGIKLRLAGIQIPILVFCAFDSMGAEALVKYRLTPVLSLFEQISKLKSALHDTASYPVHIKFNTGMQRLGFEPGDAQKIVREITSESYLKLEGVCTHFAASEDFEEPQGLTQKQVRLFQKITKEIKDVTKDPILFHYLNSGAILSEVHPQLDLARPGIALYGALPHFRKTPKKNLTLHPVLTVKSFVGFLHHVLKGETVSYGGTWSAPKNSQVAVIPLGYADGIPRALSNKGQVLIRGELCPIVGIVCMDYFMVDVTSLAAQNKGAQIGDEVVILGKQNDKTILANEIAAQAQTISYEILTGLQQRLPRVYIH